MKTKTQPAGTRPGRKRIFLVEDHPIFREGIARAIESESDLTVCGYSDSASKALTAIESLKPDLAIVDITLPGRSGLELIKDLKAVAPQIAVLVVSMHDEILFAERVLRAGAAGYVMKHADTQTVIDAIKRVLSGGVSVSPRMSERLLLKFSEGRTKAAPASVEHLTDREFEVLRSVGAGLSTAEIGRQLNLSPKTVAVHKSRIKAKLKLRTMAELMRFALASDLSQRVTDC